MVSKFAFFSLQLCNVKVNVLIDGGFSKCNSKLNLSKTRATNNLKNGIKDDMLNVNSENICFPMLLQRVFIHSAKKYGARLLHCDFQADDDIIVIAKKLDAYILSNNSDFFLADVKFILLKTLKIKNIKKNVNKKTGHESQSVLASIFNRDLFCQVYLLLYIFTELITKSVFVNCNLCIQIA